MEIRTPVEILAYVSDVGVAKTQRKIHSMLILSFFAGAFIAFAAYGSGMAAYNLLSDPGVYGVGRVLTGVIFATGLMLVILAGAELFTGNMLIIIPVLDRKAAVKPMLLNWLLVYIGNLAGSIFIAWMINMSGLLDTGSGLLGGLAIKIAAAKSVLPFQQAFILGILCNWLVCLAVWSSYAARDVAGKIMIIFFVILLFVISGFEHSIANMYYIPAGIFAKQNPELLAMAGLSAEQLAGLNWSNFFVKNLIPVTLGNMFGGVVMVGILYRMALGIKKKEK